LDILDIDGWIALEWILEKLNAEMLNGFRRLRNMFPWQDFVNTVMKLIFVFCNSS